jgi:hypothetical protein
MKQKLFWKDLFWILPASLALGTGLAFVQPGNLWLGGLAFSGVLLVGLLILTMAWRWAGGERLLFIIVALALLLRLVSAVALYVFLPISGYADSEPQQAGYVFLDAFRRDSQAWGLAQSGAPVWMAFDQKFYTDQYGGLLAFSAWVYRGLSPDAHRPLLIVLIGALVSALGVVFLWKSAEQAWDRSVMLPAIWIFALYPESILQGSSQMREPFIMTFTAIALWGFLAWRQHGLRQSWAWLVIALVGMLLVSPGTALVMLVVLAGLLWFEQGRAGISWKVLLIVSAVFLLALFLLAWGINRPDSFGASTPVGIVLGWSHEAIKWTTYQLERSSGWVQKIFGKMAPQWQLLFVTGYGMAQPVLPAAFIEPTTIVWRVVGILRSVGWYLLVPLLIYGWWAARQTADITQRRVWTWLGTISWLWIIISSLRAGGDQWDNPRYRILMLVWLALFAGYAWSWWRSRHDAWLLRIIIVEIIFLFFFTQWYISRYFHLGGQLPFGMMVLLICAGASLVMVGGWLWDRWRVSKDHA